ncbi:MAG: protein-L-isoaspartate(D-aspartate) O-methyltransferase [Myxococcales bacterium]|nr:protein-L-isoaspartate(D-aspartate) O-methyltransferase [Myxococcales bacterium]
MTLGLRPVLVTLALSLGALASSVVSSFAVTDAGIEARLSARGIRDARVLEAFARVPRGVYVPTGAPERRFDDKPLPPTFAQVISQPYMLARMIELVRPTPETRVLEVGTGSGYAAALLAELAGEVFSVGVIPESAATARLRLTREGYQNVHVKVGDGSLGWREYGPYDAIIVTALGPRVPPALIEQLVEGGVLVMPVGPPRGRQVLLWGVKKGLKLHAKEVVELHPGSAAASPSGQGDRAAPDDVRERRPVRSPSQSRNDR